MTTLQNPRHETFALTLAQGATPEAAYRAAGFSDSNRKARARELAEDPDIADRVTHLKTCLPHINALRDRFAPSILLMPQTQDEMKAWLWQVMNGTRKILPLQLRAANLFIRLNGWHLHPSTSRAHHSSESEGGSSTSPLTVSPSDSLKVSQSESLPPSPVPLTLTDHERQLLADLSSHTIAHDLAQRPVYPKEIHPFYSTMADIALVESSSVGSQLTPSSPASAAPSSPVGPQLEDPESTPVAACPSEASAKDGPQLVSDPQSPPAPQLKSKSPFGDKNENQNKNKNPIKTKNAKPHPIQRLTATA